jgi:hypothetical protein
MPVIENSQERAKITSELRRLFFQICDVYGVDALKIEIGGNKKEKSFTVKITESIKL